jgi:hypothetical protein
LAVVSGVDLGGDGDRCAGRECLEAFVPQLEAAVDGDPATEVPAAE